MRRDAARHARLKAGLGLTAGGSRDSSSPAPRAWRTSSLCSTRLLPRSHQKSVPSRPDFSAADSKDVFTLPKFIFTSVPRSAASLATPRVRAPQDGRQNVAADALFAFFNAALAVRR